MPRLTEEQFLAEIVAESEEAVKIGAFHMFRADESRHGEPGWMRESYVQEVATLVRHYLKDQGTTKVRVILTFDQAPTQDAEKG